MYFLYLYNKSRKNKFTTGDVACCDRCIIKVVSIVGLCEIDIAPIIFCDLNKM